jgi:hypothetical protein
MERRGLTSFRIKLIDASLKSPTIEEVNNRPVKTSNTNTKFLLTGCPAAIMIADRPSVRIKKYILKLKDPISNNLPPPPRNISSNTIISIPFREMGFGNFNVVLVMFI